MGWVTRAFKSWIHLKIWLTSKPIGCKTEMSQWLQHTTRHNSAVLTVTAWQCNQNQTCQTYYPERGSIHWNGTAVPRWYTVSIRHQKNMITKTTMSRTSYWLLCIWMAHGTQTATRIPSTFKDSSHHGTKACIPYKKLVELTSQWCLQQTDHQVLL